VFGLAAVFPSVAATENSRNVRQFGAVGDGAKDDSGAISAMLTALGFAVIPADGGTFLINRTITLKANESIFGGGTIKCGAEINCIVLNGDKAAAHDLNFIANGASACVVGVGGIMSPAIERCSAAGNSAPGGLHFGFIGDASRYGGIGTVLHGPISRNNQITGAPAIPLVNGGGFLFESCEAFLSQEDSYHGQQATYGFSIRWSRGRIIRPTTYAPEVGATLRANGSQTTFVFNLPKGRAAMRAAIHVNGIPTAPESLTSKANGTVWVSILSSPPIKGALIRLVAFGCPECINVNTDSEVDIEGYSLDGTGDSALVFGSDWTKTGSGYSSTPNSGGRPGRSTVGAGHIRNCLASGIAATSGCHGLALKGGHLIESYAMQADQTDFFNNAISLSNHFRDADAFYKVGPGTIDNSSGFGKGGVTVTAIIEDGLPNKRCEIWPQTYRGNFPNGREFLPAQEGNDSLPAGIRLERRSRRKYPTQPDILTSFGHGKKPLDGNGFTFFSFGDGVTQSDSASGNGIRNQAARSLQMIAGGQLNIVASAENPKNSAFNNCVVSLTFMAKAAAPATTNTGTRVLVNARFPDSQFGTFSLAIKDPAWQSYELTFSMQRAAYLYDIEISTPRGGVIANIEALELGSYSLL
jgi:hypothetical protein